MAKVKHKDKPEAAKRKKSQRGKKTAKKTGSYDAFKEYKSRKYTGMKIGRSHHWHYDKGDWKETKITPDLWEVSYAVTKRRAGRAPEKSGVPVGTAYQWYILAHQKVEKLTANDYSTVLTGLKFKIAHKRADSGKWNVKSNTQRKHLVKFLREIIDQLEKDPIPLEIEYDNVLYSGAAIPIMQTCDGGTCYEADVTLNDENMGIIKHAKSGWKMDRMDDKFARLIGDQIMHHFDS
jgi:hypothetical protein